MGDTIEYLMTITNKGSTTLVLDFADPHCDAGTLSAPTAVSGSYDPSSRTLSVGGSIQYTCSHILTSSDSSPFTNTATVTGNPPQGGPPVSAKSSVVVNVQSVLSKHLKRCPVGKVRKAKKVHGKTVLACVAKKSKKVKKPSRPPRTVSGFTG